MDADASHGPAKEIVALGQSPIFALASPTTDAKTGNQAEDALNTLKAEATRQLRPQEAANTGTAPAQNPAIAGTPAPDQGTSQAQDSEANGPSPTLQTRRAQAEQSIPLHDSQGAMR